MVWKDVLSNNIDGKKIYVDAYFEDICEFKHVYGEVKYSIFAKETSSVNEIFVMKLGHTLLCPIIIW